MGVYGIMKAFIILYLINFYTHFLIRQRWDINYQRTAQMLKETCNCEDKRIGKERISVFAVNNLIKEKMIMFN